MIVERAHLTVLLNALYEEDALPVVVSHPSPEVGDLLRVDLADPYASRVTVLADRWAYDDRREAVHQAHDQAAYEDLPDPDDYVRLLVAAGLADIANREEIGRFLRRYGHPDLEAGHPPVMAGIDANVMPWGLPDVLGIDPAGDHDGRPPVTGYALASGVKEELDWHYRQYNTRQLTEAFGEEFERLDNQPAGENREGILGLYEYRRLMATRRTDQVECDPGDEAIVEGYRSYHYDDSRKDVVLFSNDAGFVDRANDAGVPATRVEFPTDVPRETSLPWERLGRVLSLFAVVFGVVVLPRVTLYGVWNGKTGRHWQDRAVAVECRSPKVRRRLERDMRIVDAYEA